METLRKILEQADASGLAIGHFNVSDLVTLNAVFEAARDLQVPVIVGVSEGERRFDVSTLPFEDNLRQTKTAVEALKALRPEILVEGELGDIGSGSEIHDAAPDLQKGLTSPVQAKQFLDETRVDTLAPAVGNMHGML